MLEIEPQDSPQKRGKALISIGIVFALLFGGWLALQEFTRDMRMRLLQLPFRTHAEVTEDQGPWSQDGSHDLVLVRENVRSASIHFYADEWPLGCRFYADADHPDSLIIIQFNPVASTDLPGKWLNAHTLLPLPLESLPDRLQLLDQKAIE